MRIWLMGWLGLLALATPVAAEAGDWPQDRERLTVVGVNFGVGSAQAQEGSETSARYGGPQLEARVGYGVSNWVAVSAEGTLFYRQVDDFTWTLGSIVAAGSLYPGGGGLFVKAGVGWGIVNARAFAGALQEINLSKNGLALLGAVGYEFRVSQRVGVGPQFDWSWIELDENDSVDYWSITVVLNWYN